MDEQDFIERTRAIKQKLYRYACAMLQAEADREDALQEALLKAWSNRSRLRQVQYFETWLIRILINECKNAHRRRTRAPIELPDSLPAPEPQNADLWDALMAIDAKYRLVILLHYVDGYGAREIAGMLGIPQGTVLWRMHHARKLLKARLEECAL